MAAEGDKKSELICLGRAAVDLYAQQVGCGLEEASSFAKYLGGSPANVAYGGARLGLRTTMLSRVGAEQMGRYVGTTLAAAGVDVSHLQVDEERLTGLVLLGLKDESTFPLLFYRENCADMAIAWDEVDVERLFDGAKALLVSGTHLSTPAMAAVTQQAIAAAKEAGLRVVFDIDYRPVLWGVTGRGEGANRFVSHPPATTWMQAVLPRCDLVVGTDEEFAIALGVTPDEFGGEDGTATAWENALQKARQYTQATLVLKRGARGCVVLPASQDEEGATPLVVDGRPVQVLNVLGAGDAFMAGFLRGWLRDASLETCARWGNACGALVVARHGCAPAMPSWAELEAVLYDQDVDAPQSRWQPDTPRVSHLHRVAARAKAWPSLFVLAFDHRSQFETMAKSVVGPSAPASKISKLKGLIAQGVHTAVAAQHVAGHAGVLVDDKYGAPVLAQVTGGDLWIGRPVEEPGSRPLRFAAGSNLGLTLSGWPLSHVAKCLVLYHPDDDQGLRKHQQDSLRQLQQACQAQGREFLVEVIIPGDMKQDESTLARALAQIYDAGIVPDWWKLAPPSSRSAWEAVEGVIGRNDPDCRGVLLLGQGVARDALVDAFALAVTVPLCKGFAVGRSIFEGASVRWFAGDYDDKQVIQEVATEYSGLIAAWRGLAAQDVEAKS